MDLQNATTSDALPTISYGEPYRATQLWSDIVQSFEKGMTVGRHWRQLRAYDDSFTASEAINYLLSYLQRNPHFGLSVTRVHTVRLLQKLYKARVFEDVRGRKYDRDGFTDSNSRLYRFCQHGPDPRSPFSFCRALVTGIRSPDASAKPSESKIVQRQLKFNDKENIKSDKVASAINQVDSNSEIKETSLLHAMQQTMDSHLMAKLPLPTDVSKRGISAEKQSKLYEQFPEKNNLTKDLRALKQINLMSNSNLVEDKSKQGSGPYQGKPQDVETEIASWPDCGAVKHSVKHSEMRLVSRPLSSYSQQNNLSTVAQKKPDAVATHQINARFQKVVHQTFSWPKNLATNETDKTNRSFHHFQSRFCSVLGIKNIEEIFSPSEEDKANVVHNLTNGLDSNNSPHDVTKEDHLPLWLLSALKYLAYWPTNENLPQYLGFERDVFQAVVAYFEDLVTGPIFSSHVSSILLRILSFLKLWPFEKHTCMETSFGVGDGEPKTRLVQLHSGKQRGLMPEMTLMQSYLAQPRLIASPVRTFSNPLSLVASGFNINERIQDNNLDDAFDIIPSHLRSMPDVSICGDSLIKKSKMKKRAHGQFQLQKDICRVEPLPRKALHPSISSSPDDLRVAGKCLHSTHVAADGRNPWDRSQSTMYLTRARDRCQSNSSLFTNGNRKSCSSACLAPCRSSCAKNSSTFLLHKESEPSPKFLSRSISKGAVTASYRLAIDKNSSFSTPQGKSLFSNLKNSVMPTERQRMLDVLQLCSLLLPPSVHQRFVVLLRLLGKLAVNKYLILDEHMTVKQLVQRQFACCFFCFDGSSDDLLECEIFNLMIDQYEDLLIQQTWRFPEDIPNRGPSNSRFLNKAESKVMVKENAALSTKTLDSSESNKHIRAEFASKSQTGHKMSAMLRKPLQRLKSMRF